MVTGILVVYTDPPDISGEGVAMVIGVLVSGDKLNQEQFWENLVVKFGDKINHHFKTCHGHLSSSITQPTGNFFLKIGG